MDTDKAQGSSPALSNLIPKPENLYKSSALKCECVTKLLSQIALLIRKKSTFGMFSGMTGYFYNPMKFNILFQMKIRQHIR